MDIDIDYDQRVSRCVVPGCKSSRTKIKCHRFPKDQIQSNIWKRIIKNPLLDRLDYITINQRYRICKLHFPEDAYYRQTNKPRLKENALPSLNLNIKKELEEVPTSSRTVEETNTESEIEINQKQTVKVETPEIIDNTVHITNHTPTRVPIFQNSFSNNFQRFGANPTVHLADDTSVSSLITPHRIHLIRREDLSPVSRILYDRQSQLSKQNNAYRKIIEQLLAEQKKLKDLLTYDEFIQKLPIQHRPIVELFKQQSDLQDQNIKSEIHYTEEQKAISLHIFRTTTPFIWRELQKFIPLPSEEIMQSILDAEDHKIKLFNENIDDDIDAEVIIC